MKLSALTIKRQYWLAGLILGGGYLIYKTFTHSPEMARSLEVRLIEMVQRKSDGLYILEIGATDIDGMTASAVFTDIRISIDSSRLMALAGQHREPPLAYTFHINKLRLNKADILAYLSAKTIHLNKLDISGCSVFITRLHKEQPAPNNQTDREKLKQSIQDAGLMIDTLHADNLDINYTNLKKQTHSIKNVFLDLYQFATDSSALQDKSRIFLSRKMRLSIDSIRMPLSDENYRLGARHLVVTVGDTSITSLQDVFLKPAKNISLEKLAAGMGVQQDVFDIRVHEIVIGNLNLQALLEDSSIQAGMVLVNNPAITIFHDQRLPPSTESKIGKYPHQALFKLPFSIRIPAILVQHGSIHYEEKNSTGGGIGKIHFTDLSGKIGPIMHESAVSSIIRAELSGKFMESARISAVFEFPVSTNGRFSVYARFSPFSVQALNEATIPLGQIRLKNGKITRLDCKINGNNNYATGTTTLNYEKLEIEVLKTTKHQGIKENKLLSLVANTFLLHKNNLVTDKFPDSYTVTYQRVPTKSFFNLVWKTVFYSVKANTGIGAKGKDKDRAIIH